MKFRTRALSALGVLCLLLTLLPGIGRASPPTPGSNDWLDYWTFGETNDWRTVSNHVPVSYTNISSSPLGHGNALLLDSTNAAWVRYKIFETNSVQLEVDSGTVMFWFAPSWSGTNAGGNGPGAWGRLLEVGNYTTNASEGWWSIYCNPPGDRLFFAAQTNGAEALYLTAPIEWTTNYWHHIALTYAATGSCLYVNGELVTNGAAMTYWPGTNVLTNGFYIGSDNTGTMQARGMFDDLSTFDHPLDADTIAAEFYTGSGNYYLNLLNEANFASAPSSPSYLAGFNAITGSGYLLSSTNGAVGCVTNSRVWITNVVAVVTNNGCMNVTFTIAGGSDGVLYDVFANSVLSLPASTNRWAWMGQGYHCTSYTLTNLSSATCFLVLGTPVDDDLDGLTTAYENLVSKTDPDNPDTDGDGLGDAWEILNDTNPLVNDASADPDHDGLTNLQEYKYGSNPHQAPTWSIWVSAPSGGNLP